MTGSDSIDLSLKNIWRSWFAFRKGKNCTCELHEFQYNLEKNLIDLFCDLNAGTYIHGGYRKFVVCDNKRREISVARIRDRVVHRLLYDYLVGIFDKTFIYDAWSCRVGKGLHRAIERTQRFVRANPEGYICKERGGKCLRTNPNPRVYIWKSDIKKFFDSVDHEILFKLVARKVRDKKALEIISEIIESYGPCGMPIGNLTSQIFANIYLNELDRFMKHTLRQRKYLRYGDDFILLEPNIEKLNSDRIRTIEFLKNELKLEINPKSDKTIKVSQGLKFLGVKLHPFRGTLNKRNLKRIFNRLDSTNVAGYRGLIKVNCPINRIEEFDWKVLEISTRN